MNPRIRACGAAAVALWLLAACAAPALRTACADRAANVAAFEQELRDLQRALAIPGLAYVAIEDGRVVGEHAFGHVQGDAAAPFTTATPLRVASVTKALAALTALRLIEEDRLELDRRVRSYVPTLTLPDEVTVRQLLTHTSEGEFGAEYVYGSTRYGRLADVIAAASGQTFEQALRTRVTGPAGMHWHASPDLGAAGGLVASVDDMAALLVALDAGTLLRPESMLALATPSRAIGGDALPVSLGWFVRDIGGERVLWSFGQDDPDHSGALLLYLPARRLALFVLANANTLSDPFRLLMGDVAKSPFATSFLRLFAASPPGTPIRRPARDSANLDGELRALETAHRYDFRDELIGWALLDLWTDRAPDAQRKLDLAQARATATTADDAVLHFAALRLPDPTRKDAAIAAGARLLARHPTNQWLLLAQGYLLQQRDRPAEAASCFERLLALPNQEPDSLHQLFGAWSRYALAEIHMQRDPARARTLLQQILDSGVQGETRDSAQALMDQLR